MKNFLDTHANWIIDGNYTWCCYKERMTEADQIIFLRFSRWHCLYRAFRRYLTYRGKVRESMAVGFPERFDWEFIRWILWEGRSREIQNRYQNLYQQFSDKVLILQNQKELEDFKQFQKLPLS